MISQRIKSARERKGMSQRGLARALDIQPSSVNSWESDKSSPTTDNLAVVAVLLDVSFEWLSTGRGPMEIPLYDANPAPDPPDFEAWKKFLNTLTPAQREDLLKALKSVSGQ